MKFVAVLVLLVAVSVYASTEEEDWAEYKVAKFYFKYSQNVTCVILKTRKNTKKIISLKKMPNVSKFTRRT